VPKQCALPSELPRNVFKTSPVGVRVEHRVTVVQKPRRVDLDRSKDLDALSLSCHRNLRPAADPPPGRVEGRVLLKAGLLGKEETPLFCLGFFKGGRGRRRQRAWAVASARARRRRGH
jgi:hypothetical protein